MTAQTACFAAVIRAVLCSILAAFALLVLASPARAEAVYGPVDDEVKTGRAGEVRAATSNARRDRNLNNEFDRSGSGVLAVSEYLAPAENPASMGVSARDRTGTQSASIGDEEAKAGWEGEVSLSATYARRGRDLISDFDRSGLGAEAAIGFRLPAGSTTNLRIEAEAQTDKYTTSYGANAEIAQQLGDTVKLSLAASGHKHLVTLESLDTDQAALRAGLEVKTGNTVIEGYARHRWRRYDDLAAGDGQGWQFGSRLRQRLGSYHWAEARLSHDRIDDNGGRHGYRRTSVGLDYSHPLTKRLRLRPGFDYREWTYQGRYVADLATNPRRKDRLVRPELGLAWGKTKGLFVRASAAWDFYRSNDPRFTSDGPRLRLIAGYRF